MTAELINRNNKSPEFHSFNKIPRLSREIIITEKIDGTNAQIYIDENANLFAGSKNRWLTPDNDNFGFAAWVLENSNELLEKLGPGRHYGEWWGQGIQRKYGLTYKKFSLFNVKKWSDNTLRPSCCEVVPLIATHDIFDTEFINHTLEELKKHGSYAQPGFMNPEGIVIYHNAGNILFKKTIEGDELPKSLTWKK